LELLDVLPIRGGGWRGAAQGALRAAKLLPESRALLRRLGPRGVFSIGGYAAGPVSLAAKTLGLPLALMEPNSVIGLANWLLAPLVDRAYTAFEVTDQKFSPAVVRRLGVPLRPGFTPTHWAATRGPLKILVLGGSQGARALNENVPHALAGVSAPLDVVHQCGPTHLEEVQRRYSETTLSGARVVSFIDDMPRALAQADLVISRSGASAVSEIAAVGRASLLIPYPYASGDHQTINARTLETLGAARTIANAEASTERLRSEVELLASDPSRIALMAAAALAWGRPEAAGEVAADFLDCLNRENP